MKNNQLSIALVCSAVLFCVASAYGQGYDTCSHLKSWEYDDPASLHEYTVKYDTLKMYIEKCAVSDPYSYQAFPILDGTVNEYAPNDTNRFILYRNWLISVLYLNTTIPAYFCNCLASIGGTYQIGKYNPLGSLTVLNYLRHIPNCYGTGLDKEFSKDSTIDFQEGYNPTNLPPLDSLGLGFLLKAGAPSPTPSPSSQYLTTFTSSPNPFIKETTLEFTLNRMSYITLAIYDELGRLVWGDGRGSSLDVGTHIIQIDGSKLPSGTLYARIATGFGEVKTVKLIHE